ncbi:DsbA family protein [Photobacterium sp.]|uniref:DsbA family protein n=1 Tax=Photobacterium sp. TaxID=660 RepID=UPI00299F0C33|nr:DsbA family protein [Photobacterium sp.]MDX1300953.1 DsbA family protein [Photobacterium sp.]
MVTVHYFYDPMCGWCYGATTLIEAIAKSHHLTLKLHPGGMISSCVVEPTFRDHILKNDTAISELTGARFGQVYLERVTSTDEFVLDSYLPIRAILVADSLGMDPFLMLKAIQKAHYVDGKSVNKRTTLEEIATQLGLDQALWNEKMQTEESLEHAAVDNSHQLMTRLKVQGYPTLFLEDNDQFIRLPHTKYYGQGEKWHTFLESLT